MAKKRQKTAYHLLIQQGKIHLAPPKQISIVKNVPYKKEQKNDEFKIKMLGIHHTYNENLYKTFVLAERKDFGMKCG